MENDSFIITDVALEELNTLVKNIMKQTKVTDPNEAIRLVNSGQVKISALRPKWTEEGGVIYFTLTSDGTTGEQWIDRLERKGYLISKYAKSYLLSNNFKPTLNVTTKVAVLKDVLLGAFDTTAEQIRKEARNRHLYTPNAELACLIRYKFSKRKLKSMGLGWLVVMHRPISYPEGNSFFLSVGSFDDGSWLYAEENDWNGEHDFDTGFVFACS